MKDNHKATRIKAGKYKYRGFHVHCLGRNNPDHRWWWEAIDHDGTSFAQSFSLKCTKCLIDSELDGKDSSK